MFSGLWRSRFRLMNSSTLSMTQSKDMLRTNNRFITSYRVNKQEDTESVVLQRYSHHIITITDQVDLCGPLHLIHIINKSYYLYVSDQ